MRIAIIGVGAMGSLLGAHLGLLGDVTLIGAWPEQIAAVQAEGLRLRHPDGHYSHHAVRITTDPAAAYPADLALILVKSRQTEQAAVQAQQALAAAGLALTLQNGLGNLEKIAAVLGPERAALGVTAQGATMLEPGLVHHAGRGPTHLAQTPATAAFLATVADLFGEAGLETHLVDDVAGLVWGKLAVNAAINPLTALLRVPNGFLAEHEAARLIMSQAASEAAAVARAQGIALPFADAAQRALEVAQATAANHSSMLQDVARGAPTEIEAICGAIVAYGRDCGVPTPVNEKLLHLVRTAEAADWRRELSEPSPIANNHSPRSRLQALISYLNLEAN